MINGGYEMLTVTIKIVLTSIYIITSRNFAIEDEVTTDLSSYMFVKIQRKINRNEEDED